MQFLPATQPLVTEAVREAVSQTAAGLTTCVVTAEHLMAIALQTGRAKDHARLVMFVESGVADMTRFRDILTREESSPEVRESFPHSMSEPMQQII